LNADAAANKLVGQLVRLTKDRDGANAQKQSEARAAFAQLRRATGKPLGQVVEAMPYVVPYLPDEGPDGGDEAARDRQWQILHLVATLFAEHPWDGAAGAPRNLGATMRRLHDNPSAEKRFTALLNAPQERLSDYLLTAVRLAKAGARPGGPVPINWFQLAHDLLAWDHADRPVQIEWARALWTAPKAGSPADETAAEE